MNRLKRRLKGLIYEMIIKNNSQINNIIVKYLENERIDFWIKNTQSDTQIQ
jgi:hypothetical protein